MEQSLHDERHRDCTLEKEDTLLYLSNQPVAGILLRDDVHTSIRTHRFGRNVLPSLGIPRRAEGTE